MGSQILPKVYTAHKCSGLQHEDVHSSSVGTFQNVQTTRASYQSIKASSSYHNKPLVKMCGVTSAKDAALAAEAGADFIGMIIVFNACRCYEEMPLQEMQATQEQQTIQNLSDTLRTILRF